MDPIVIKLIPWDADEVFPDGTHSIEAARTDTAQATKFATDLVKFLLDGGQVLGVLPMAQPGRAMVLGYLTGADEFVAPVDLELDRG